jgi:hypothetical protein
LAYVDIKKEPTTSGLMILLVHLMENFNTMIPLASMTCIVDLVVHELNPGMKIFAIMSLMNARVLYCTYDRA